MEKMFDEISKNYDFLNNIISFFTHKRVKACAIRALRIKNGAKVLDLCTGTGDAGAIAQKSALNVFVVGVDFSSSMLKIAQKRNKEIIYKKENAENLSFENGSFDYVICAFGLRNIINKNLAIKEIFRVLKCGGSFLHLDFGEENFFVKIYDKILFFIIKFFIKNKKPYYYLLKSKKNFMNEEKLKTFFVENGFKILISKSLLFGIIKYQIVQK